MGSFVKAGETFVTDVKVLDANSRELLESASARGNGAQSILDHQIDELSRTIGRGVGLSHRRISASTEQITEVTTSSIEAYNYFLRGRDEVDKMYYDQAIQFSPEGHRSGFRFRDGTSVYFGCICGTHEV